MQMRTKKFWSVLLFLTVLSFVGCKRKTPVNATLGGQVPIRVLVSLHGKPLLVSHFPYEAKSSMSDVSADTVWNAFLGALDTDMKFLGTQFLDDTLLFGNSDKSKPFPLVLKAPDQNVDIYTVDHGKIGSVSIHVEPEKIRLRVAGGGTLELSELLLRKGNSQTATNETVWHLDSGDIRSKSNLRSVIRSGIK